MGSYHVRRQPGSGRGPRRFGPQQHRRVAIPSFASHSRISANQNVTLSPDSPHANHNQSWARALNVHRIRRCPHQPASRHRQRSHRRVISRTTIRRPTLTRVFSPSFSFIGLWNHQGRIRRSGSSKMLFPLIVRLHSCPFWVAYGERWTFPRAPR